MEYRFPAGEDAEAVAARLIGQLLRCGTAAIVGPHGTGKSTLLHTLLPLLKPVFPELDRIQLNSATDCLAALRAWRRGRGRRDGSNAAGDRCLVIDGFEQLGWTTRQRLIWQAMRWRKTSLFKRRGQQPQTCLLVTAHRPQLAVDTLYRTLWDDRIVRRLTEEKLAGLPWPERSSMLRAADHHAMTLNHAPSACRNVRDYWFALYDEYERLRCHSPHAFAPVAGSSWRNAR